ncbi:MAG: DNA polymerase III subunit gamma/tau [bacterium]
MSYQALARKWRPKAFDEVIGQEHVVAALRNGLDSQRVHHAFLFTGTRGVGKTTLARIFAKALNCEQGVGSTPCGECVACRGVDQGNFIDLIEVDAASRTTVDDTRELLDNVQYTPTQGRFKIYLIDEVHMLSTHSFNALLKTLEEPPEHVKFLLATTDPQKLPTTILSRCIQFNLKAMDIAQLTAQLERILSAEEIAHDPPALAILARSANGSVRDALSLLDQGIAFGDGEVRTESIRAMLGMIDDQYTLQLLTQVGDGDADDALRTIGEMAKRSADFANALDEMLTTLHNLALCQISPQAVEWKGVDAATLAELAGRIDAELLQLLYQIALIGKRDLQLAPDPRSGFEMVVLRMISFHPEHSTAQSPAPGKSLPENQKEVEKPAINTGNRTKNHIASANENHAKPMPKKDAIERKSVANADDANESPHQNADAPAESRADPKPTLEQLCEGVHWATCIEQSGLGGLPRELMMNAAPVSADGDALRLTLAAAHRPLLNPDRVQQAERQLSKYLARPLKLHVALNADGAQGGETPSQQQHRANREKHKAAAQAFENDPNVQELVDLFDAEIVADSIRPPST